MAEITKTAPPSGESAVPTNIASKQVEYSKLSTAGTFITVVTKESNANKHYKRTANGEIEKITPDYWGVKIAKTVAIKDLRHFHKIHGEVSKHSNQFLILDYVQGTKDGEEFEIMSKANVAKEAGVKEKDVKGMYQRQFDFLNTDVADGKPLKYCARLGNTFTRSNIFMFDRDAVRGMPEELIFPDIESWWARLCDAFPLLKGAGYLIAKSNSGRILVDGKPYAPNNEHIYCMAKDGSDIKAFGQRLLVHSFSRDIGFMRPIGKPNENGKQAMRHWTLFDPSVFGGGREVFDGKPTVEGEGLTVIEVSSQLIEGGFVDTKALKAPSKAIQNKAELSYSKSGGKAGRGSYTVKNFGLLTLDTVIECKRKGYGGLGANALMLRELLKRMKAEDITHLRCETPYRPESRTENAFIDFTSSGDPHLHDNGTGITYHLNPLTKDLFAGAEGFNPNGNAGLVPTDDGWKTTAEVFADVEGFNPDGNASAGELVAGLTTQITALDEDSTPDEINTVLTLLYGVDDLVALEQNLKKITKATGITKTTLVSKLKELRPTESFETESQAKLLINIGKSHYLFHDDNQEGYVEYTFKGIKCTVKIKSEDYKSILTVIYHHGTDGSAGTTALSSAIGTLDALAIHKGNLEVLAVRSYKTDEVVYIDLGDEQRTIVRVTKAGWDCIKEAPVKFLLKKGMTALPMPDRTVTPNLMLLKKHININEDDFSLVYAFMLCALAGVAPYPSLILNGEEGTGKSFTTTTIRALVDPNTVGLRLTPEKIDDLLVSASSCHILVIDNLSNLARDVADALCVLATGGGIAKRKLHTDGDLHLMKLQKPVILNGIDDVSSRSDLISRGLILDLPYMDGSVKRDEKSCKVEFEKDKVSIFNGLLGAIASGLKHSDSIEFEELPRMADMATWVTACERDIGLEGDLLKAHARNQKDTSGSIIESSPVGLTLLKLIDQRGYVKDSPTALFEILKFGQSSESLKSFPKSPGGMGKTIKRLTPAFRKKGIIITQRSSGTRAYTITKTEGA